MNEREEGAKMGEENEDKNYAKTQSAAEKGRLSVSHFGPT